MSAQTSPQVLQISACKIWPQKPPDSSSSSSSSPRRYDFSSWDLPMLPIGPIQKGILFHIPSQHLDPIIDRLKNSLSVALAHFLPLSGRLVTEPCPAGCGGGGGLFTFIRCGGEDDDGAEFLRAVAGGVCVADIVESRYTPAFVRDFFPHAGMINHDGHHLPLLAVQVTELTDGIFLGCTVNHLLCDGTTLWNFMRAWSDVSSGKPLISDGRRHPLLIHNTSPPIKLPFQTLDTLIDRSASAPPDPAALLERIFHFSSASVAQLKEQANFDIVNVDGDDWELTPVISSFLSVSALIWRSISRARSLPETDLVSCKLACNYRSRLSPPFPPSYFGNCVGAHTATTTSGDLLAGNLGRAASRLHDIVGALTDADIRRGIDRWVSEPVFFSLSDFAKNNGVAMTSSPRFEIYECEFGLGKAAAVLCGGANKYSGKVTSFPGREDRGSMDMEICLSPETMEKLEGDLEFMSFVSK